MEPTLASKVQGDYKIGKRIKTKKVIPCIASHYRKDRIWLRRTRPNKRNYQVVIAIDDSSSMSENNCGNVAIEALVTVCPAMSQLEVGNLAVASFGKGENIQLLHDFDQPFTGEAGVQDMMEPTVSPDGSWHQNRVGASYMDNGSLMYLMPGYNSYGLQSFLGEGMSGYLWNSEYTSEPEYQSRASRATKSTLGIKSSTKSNGSYSERHCPLDVQSRQSTSDLSQLLQSPHLWSLNQVFLLEKLAVYGQEIRSHVVTFHHMGSC